MKTWIAAAVFLMAGIAQAQMTPVGLWKTIDDDGKTEKSLVRIYEEGGAIFGKIEKILDPSAPAGATCEKCTDDRKGKPIVGLVIVRNLKADKDKQWWEGGDVTDPKNGKIYKAAVRPLEDGKKLQLRGYIGPFYRTQTWTRVE